MRLLGFFSDITIVGLSSVLKLAWSGFLINLVSGTALFISQATFFATHIAFLIKITAIILALVNAAFIQSLIKQQGQHWDSVGATPGRVKVLALVSLALWVTAIIAGRLIAYID
jgi:hypothetical protein